MYFRILFELQQMLKLTGNCFAFIFEERWQINLPSLSCFDGLSFGVGDLDLVSDFDLGLIIRFDEYNGSR